MTITVRAVFQEGKKLYPQIYLGVCMKYEMLHNKTDKSKECVSCHYWFFKIKILILKNLSVMVVMIYQWCVMNWKILQYSKYKVFMTDVFYGIWLIIKLLIF